MENTNNVKKIDDMNYEDIQSVIRKLSEADINTTVTELKFTKEGNLENQVEVFDANGCHGVPSFFMTESCGYLVIDFNNTNSVPEKLAIKTAFDIYLKKSTKSEIEQDYKGYLLEILAYIEDEKNNLVKGIKISNPMMVVEDIDNKLKIVANRENIIFFAEEVDYYKIREQVEYEIEQEKELKQAIYDDEEDSENDKEDFTY